MLKIYHLFAHFWPITDWNAVTTMTIEDKQNGKHRKKIWKLWCFSILQVVIALGFFPVTASFSPKVKKGRRNKGVANCLQMGIPQNQNASSDEVLRFIHRNRFMIVPASNPPLPKQGRPVLRPAKRSTRDMSSSGDSTRRIAKCPFTFQVKDFRDTVPRFLSFARCSGCHSNCEPVMFTHQLLTNKCKSFWLWSEKTLPVAFVWVQN